MRHNYHLIRYTGIEYIVETYGPRDGWFIVSTWRGSEKLPGRLSKNKKLLKLIDMWWRTKCEMKPGIFITKVTGSKCHDLHTKG